MGRRQHHIYSLIKNGAAFHRKGKFLENLKLGNDRIIMSLEKLHVEATSGMKKEILGLGSGGIGRGSLKKKDTVAWAVV